MKAPLQTQGEKPESASNPRKRIKKEDVNSNWKALNGGKLLPKKPRTMSSPAEADVAHHDDDKKNPPSIKCYTPHNGIIALDCEMVGDVSNKSMLARVCVVDLEGKTLLDEYVRPVRPVKDYRTRFSGIKPHHVKHAKDFTTVQTMVSKLLENKVVVGHGLKNDFDCLQLDHPRHLMRDTSFYGKFVSSEGRPRKLKELVLERLNYSIQEGYRGHDPSVDAKASLHLYLQHAKEWEAELARKKKKL